MSFITNIQVEIFSKLSETRSWIVICNWLRWWWVSSMNETFMIAILVWVTIVVNHTIYNYSEDYTVTNASFEKKIALSLS